MIFCLVAEAVDSKWVDALNVNDMEVNFIMVMVMLLMVEGREKLA